MFVSDTDTVLKRITSDFDPDCPSFLLKDDNNTLVLSRGKKSFNLVLLKNLMKSANVNKYYVDLYSKKLDECVTLTKWPVFYKHWCKSVLDISFSYMYNVVEEELSTDGMKGKKLEKEVEKKLLKIYENMFS